MTTTMNQTYAEHLNRLAGIELVRHADALGAVFDGRGLKIPFYNHTYFVMPGKIEDVQGQPPTDSVGLVLCQYLLRSPKHVPNDGQRVTFRELDGAGPLVSSFAGNTNKLIAGTFASRLEDLQAMVRQMGAQPESEACNFDLFVRFNALPRVPIFLQFNSADDLFPAQATLLFHQSAETYLDMRSLFILGTYLAGQLIQGVD